MINRMLNRLPEDEADLLKGMKTWSDNKPGTWYLPWWKQKYCTNRPPGHRQRDWRPSNFHPESLRPAVLHWQSNGGTEYGDAQYAANTVARLDRVPIREGYTFTGWYADAALTQRITEITMIGLSALVFIIAPYCVKGNIFTSKGNLREDYRIFILPAEYFPNRLWRPTYNSWDGAGKIIMSLSKRGRRKI